jgi:hypothetical protein
VGGVVLENKQKPEWLGHPLRLCLLGVVLAYLRLHLIAVVFIVMDKQVIKHISNERRAHFRATITVLDNHGRHVFWFIVWCKRGKQCVVE